jgi:hypothetical protein
MKVLPHIAQDSGSTGLSAQRPRKNSKYGIFDVRYGAILSKQGERDWNAVFALRNSQIYYSSA